MGARYTGFEQDESSSQGLTAPCATSLGLLARHSIQILDRSRPRREWNGYSSVPSSVPAALSDCSTSPRSSQGYFSESDAASSAPSSPRTPRQREEDPVDRNALSLPIRTSRPRIALRASSHLVLPPINSGPQAPKLPNVGELLRLGRPVVPFLSHVTAPPCENERKLSTVSQPVTDAEYVWSRQSSPGTETLAPTRRQSNDLGPTRLRSWLSAGPVHTYMQDDDLLPLGHSRHCLRPRVSWERTASPSSLTPRSYTEQGRLYYRPHDPMGISVRRVAKEKNNGHCNKPYTTEQSHYIRYHLMDLGLSWKEVQAIFDAKFPDDDWERTEQGIQGKYYRSNQELPCIDPKSDTYMGLPNGHVKSKCVKSRPQNGQRHLYTLLYLYPEAAMTYDWLSGAEKAKAMARAEIRRRSREHIKQVAMDRGAYDAVSKEPCACCPSSQKRQQKGTQRREQLQGAKSVDVRPPARRLSSSLTVKTEPTYGERALTIKTESVDLRIGTLVKAEPLDMKVAWT